jgi:pyridoxal 5'-phosphate synthase pdxS subunit
MALERVPSDIRKQGGVARMSPPELILDIMKTVSIPVMAKCRIGHFAEAQILQQIGVDYIDESEVLTPADEQYHINKNNFKIPFVCGATNLGEALRRIAEGAALIRTKGEPGTGNIIEAVRHLRKMNQDIKRVISLEDDELVNEAKILGAPVELLYQIKKNKKLPVPSFAAGGIATPADAVLAMQLGAETVFVGSGIFKSENPALFAQAIVKAVNHFNDPAVLLEASMGLPQAMPGLEMKMIAENEKMSERGW